FRLFQRQCREERDVDGTISRRARIERVGDVIGLAKPERQSDHEPLADVTNDVFRDRFRIAEQFWHDVPIHEMENSAAMPAQQNQPSGTRTSRVTAEQQPFMELISTPFIAGCASPRASMVILRIGGG